MIFYLGQSVGYSWGKILRPAIVTGFTKYGYPLLSYKMANGEFKLHDSCSEKDILMLRQENKNAPTGHEIYYGTFCKNVVVKNVNMKLPEAGALDKEFETIKKLLPSE